jgi:mannose-6-phosphate isomerase-like protein (cupin superfamily)
MGTALLSLQQTSIDVRLARSVWFRGALITVHADSDDTNGKFALFEVSGCPGGEPPLHIHENEDEMFYVVEGRLQAVRGSEEITLDPGDSAFLPRRVPHTFKVISSFARAIVYVTPGGFEGYFRDLGEPAGKLALPNYVPLPDVPEMLRVGSRYGLTFLP